MDIGIRRKLGGAVWGVGLGVALVWGALDGAGAEGVGYGFSPPVNVAALETGRIRELTVSLNDSVTPDEVLVRMDPAPLLEQREVAEAELLAVQEQAAADAMNQSRRFAEGVEGALVDRAKLSAKLQADRAEAENLRQQVSLEQDLAASGAASQQEVDDLERELHVVEARIEANQAAVATAGQAASSARSRNDQLHDGNPWSVVAATRSLEALDGRIARLDLKAGIDGQVSWIFKTEGDVVSAGDAVLQVRKKGTTEVVAFFTPAQVTGMEAGERASVRRSTGQVISGKLVSVGAGPEQVPTQLWRLPSWPEYGVPVVVQIDSEVAPDEPVTVRI